VGGAFCTNERVKKCIQILVRKLEGKRPLGRTNCTCEGNIRMGLMEIWWEVVDWIHFAQDRDQWQVLVNTAMDLRVP
jgi:hypothetical protein